MGSGRGNWVSQSVHFRQLVLDILELIVPIRLGGPGRPFIEFRGEFLAQHDTAQLAHSGLASIANVGGRLIWFAHNVPVAAFRVVLADVTADDGLVIGPFAEHRFCGFVVVGSSSWTWIMCTYTTASIEA